MELGDYRASVQDVTNSGNDPGDGLADALELAMGGTRLGYIDHFGDRDRFRVELQTGHTYIIEQRSLENLEYPYIRGVYDASGVRISGNADDSGSYKSLGGLVQFTAPEDGTHYVSVSHGGDKWWLPCVCDLGSYQMAIYDVTHIDDYNADTATEGTLRMGQWKQGKVEKAHDKDWYAVDLTTGTRYRILVQDRCSVPWQRSCDDRGTLWYPSLHGINDSEGTMIPNSSAGSGSGLEESALKAFTTSSDGRYYVSGGGGGTGTYRAKIENLGARDQTADVNINGHVVVGGYVQGQIDFPGDRDWFAVDLQAGHTYEIDMRGGEGGYSDSQGNLIWAQLQGIYDAAGERVPNTGGNIGQNPEPSTIVFTPQTGGRFYISAQGRYPPWYLGTYTLYITDRDGPDDYRSDTQTEGKVAVCGWIKGKIEREEDQDWFAVDLDEGSTYRIDLEREDGPAGVRDPLLHGIYDSESKLISGTTNDNKLDISEAQWLSGHANTDSRVFFTPEKDGRYYTAAGHAGWQEHLGLYTLSVTPTGSCRDDSGPDFGAATATRALAD